MPVLFPNFDHVPLRNSPLKEVVCQIRFTPILSLTQDQPVDFQEIIRTRFANYQTERVLLGASDPAQRPNTLPSIFRFLNQDKTRLVSLASDFFAVSTTSYKGWEAFVDDLRFAAQAVISTGLSLERLRTD